MKQPTNIPQTVLHKIVDDSLGLSESTRKRYRHDVDEWTLFTNADPSNWHPASAQAFYNRLIQERGLQANTANVKMASLRYVAKWWTAQYGGIDFVQIHSTIWNKKPDRDVLTQEQIIMLLEQCSPDKPTLVDRRDRTLFITGLETGMRRISLVGMAFENINSKQGFPVVSVPIKGRSDKRFEVPLSDTVMKAIKDLQKHLKRKEGHVFCQLEKRRIVEGYRYIQGPTLSTTAVNLIVTKRAKASGIEHIHPHLFRHTYVTGRLADGFMPHHVAAITGHKIEGVGAMGGYVDMKAMAETARNSTPPWFAHLVDRILQ
jgi:integrase/recombinase XerD